MLTLEIAVRGRVFSNLLGSGFFPGAPTAKLVVTVYADGVPASVWTRAAVAACNAFFFVRFAVRTEAPKVCADVGFARVSADGSVVTVDRVRR